MRVNEMEKGKGKGTMRGNEMEREKGKMRSNEMEKVNKWKRENKVHPTLRVIRYRSVQWAESP